MAGSRSIREALDRLSFQHREEGFRHHTPEEDFLQYEYLKQGDVRAIAEGKRMFRGSTTGRLSEDRLMNYKYLFVASVTLACRFCIEGGLPHETAYNLSDLYIRRADACATVDAVFDVHEEMFREYIRCMQALSREEAYSRPVHLTMDYIDQRLQQPMTVQEIADSVGLSQSYLSTLFKRETGVAISQYIRMRRIETAKTLLQYTDFTCTEIAEYLCFSSDSHFSRVFLCVTGEQPTAYRKRTYRKHWSVESQSGVAT